ncbi:MAG: DUF58 domain-containing protein, partial [Microbacterium sp.]|uniref:DUF58 domain-containing protein n=1 Tax=Microbacterium sp. TaxID=51671 RepID=UPI0039E5BDF8
MRRWPLTARGVVALLLSVACFVAAVVTGLVELQVFGVLLAALVVVCLLWVLLTRRRGEVERSAIPEVPAVGETVTIRLLTRVLSTWSVPAGRWRDRLPAGLAGDTSRMLPGIGSAWRDTDRTIAWSYQVLARRRGVHRLGPSTVTITDPFGLTRRDVRVGGGWSLVVTPAAVSLDTAGSVAGGAGGARSSLTSRFSQGYDDLVARPWMPGDSVRRVHWRASAHRDELMVRQEEHETSPEATVVFDAAGSRFAPAGGVPGLDPRFEAAVTACVSVAAYLARSGFDVAVTDVEGRALCDPLAAGDEDGIERLLLAFAEVRAHLDEDLSALIARFGGATTGPLVLVTGMIGETDAAALSAVSGHSVLPVLLAVGAADGAVAMARGWRG